MSPNLTSGAINRILDKEKVSHAVVKVLEYRKISSSKSYRYQLVISDGTVYCKLFLLSPELNNLITNGELEIHAVFRIDKYSVHINENSDKFVILQNLQVLARGAKVKTGDIINSAAASSTAAEVDHNSELGSEIKVESITAAGHQKNAISSVDPTTSSSPHQNRQFRACNLTAGAIKKMLNGDNVYGAVVQIVCVKTLNTEDCYLLMIRDDMVYCPHVKLSRKLNRLVVNGKLGINTVISVHKCSRILNSKFILLERFAIKDTRVKVNEKTRNRVHSPFSLVTTNDTVTDHKSIMGSKLTPDAVRRICEGENVSNPVLQVFTIKQTQGSAGDSSAHFVLTLSDGVFSTHFHLDDLLSPLVTTGQLERFAIIRVEKYIYEVLDPEDKLITLVKLSILEPGASVDGFIFSRSTQPTVTTFINELTAGSINRILARENVSSAVIQILRCEKIPETRIDLYRLMISDGVTTHSFAMLGAQLNNLVTNGELEKFTVIRVTKCIANELTSDPKVILILNLAVLLPGSSLNRKISYSSSSSSSSTPAIAAEETVINSSSSSFTSSSSAPAIAAEETAVNSKSKSEFVDRSKNSTSQVNVPVQSVQPVASLTSCEKKKTREDLLKPIMDRVMDMIERGEI